MKLKTLIPFVVILAVLGGLVVFRNSQKRPETIVEQSGLEQVTTESVTADAIKKVEIHTGAAPDEKLTLAKEGDAWVVATNFNAPVKKDVIDGYLKKLTNMRGEARATAKDEAGLETFKLKEADAFHVKAYTDGEQPAIHLLFGKAPDFRSVFFRKAGDMTVYVEANDLRREAGVTGEDMAAKPTPDKWLDKDIAKIEQDKITKLAYTMPDKTLTLEKRDVPVETPAEEEKKEGEAAATPPATEKKWFATGALGETVKQDGVTRLLGRFTNLAASNIVDPAKKAELGLDSPPFKLVVSREGEGDLVLLGAHKDTAGPAHIMVEGAPKEIIYELSKFNFENIFVKGGELYDLPKLAVELDKVTRVELTSPSGPAILVKDGDNWVAEEPKLEFTLDQEKVKTLVSSAVGVQMRDYADSNQPYTHSITLHADGATHVIQGGGPTPGYEGSYAGIGVDTRTYAINRPEAENLFLAPKDLFSLKAFNVQADDINSVAITQEGKKVQTTHSETDWIVSVDGADATAADKDRAVALATFLQDLMFTDIHDAARAADWQPFLLVEFTTKDGQVHKLNVSPKEGEVHLVQLDSNASLFEMDEGVVNTLKYHFNAIQTPPDPAAEAAADAAPAEMPAGAELPLGHPPIPAAPEAGLPPAQTIEIPAQ